MPERVVRIATEVSAVAEAKLHEIKRVADTTRMLALNGEVIGALGIFFDWGEQSQAIVDGVRVSDGERDRTRALLLDADGLVIAASDGAGVLSERVQLRTDGAQAGYYSDRDAVVGFALTPGYETYEGLGWYGAIVQRAGQPVT